jgi:hypothetical protein
MDARIKLSESSTATLMSNKGKAAGGAASER